MWWLAPLLMGPPLLLPALLPPPLALPRCPCIGMRVQCIVCRMCSMCSTMCSSMCTTMLPPLPTWLLLLPDCRLGLATKRAASRSCLAAWGPSLQRWMPLWQPLLPLRGALWRIVWLGSRPSRLHTTRPCLPGCRACLPVLPCWTPAWGCVRGWLSRPGCVARLLLAPFLLFRIRQRRLMNACKPWKRLGRLWKGPPSNCPGLSRRTTPL
jgi:hypothetical protein